MKKIITAAISASVLLMASGAAMADLELAKKSGCMACHAVDKKVVGPAWKDVAVKYKGDAKAKATLIASVTNGSKGKYGPAPMPAHKGRVADADIEKLVTFIQGLK